ncbi:MAG: response regulator transcription factor [Clostridia bacterium]|jgi:DNA-binding response OmpR family regulator|nr:response regulator transcription factor [Clostridia bacterium]
MAKILVLEDERAINELVALNLSMVGYTVAQAYTGAEALALAKKEPFDLLILDVMLPDTDGFTVYEKLKGTPAIFLTALGETADKVKGFERGADDYIVKPFEMTELLLRVEAVLRRTQKTEEHYRIDGMDIDFGAKTVTLDGRPVDLTMQEYSLLEVLVKNRNIALSRQRLMKEAWDISFMGESRTVDVHVQRLRKKLNLGDHIATIYRFGYRFEEEP